MNPHRRRPSLFVLAAALGLTAVPLGLGASAAQAAPVLTVTSTVDAGFPRAVPPAGSGAATPITVTVASSEPVNGVTVTASSEDGGLVIGNATQSLGQLAGSRTVTFSVAGAAAGLHELFVEVTSPSVSASTSLPYVWTNGSPLPGGRDELEPMSFGFQSTTAGGDRSVQVLTILPDNWAYVGLPGKGTPKCKNEGGGCFRYSYSSESDVLQVGTGIIGALYGEDNPPALYVEGIVPPQPGQLFGAAQVSGPSQFADASTNVQGTYRYSGAGSGLTREQVTFKKNAFKLTYAKNGGKTKKLKGTFQLKKKGKITFRNKRGKVVQRGTVLVLDKASSEHGPFQPGIWLILSGKKGKTPDGNLLLQR